MQDSLPAGGLRLYREGVEPSGSLRKVSGYISILLSRTSPVARIVYAITNRRTSVRIVSGNSSRNLNKTSRTPGIDGIVFRSLGWFGTVQDSERRGGSLSRPASNERQAHLSRVMRLSLSPLPAGETAAGRRIEAHRVISVKFRAGCLSTWLRPWRLGLGASAAALDDG
jgi:hypothetical protein